LDPSERNVMGSRNLFAELKRRNVYKVAIAYIVGGWALSQGIAQVFPVFDVPNGAIRAIVLLITLAIFPRFFRILGYRRVNHAPRFAGINDDFSLVISDREHRSASKKEDKNQIRPENRHMRHCLSETPGRRQAGINRLMPST
jgi:hypothetical protein